MDTSTSSEKINLLLLQLLSKKHIDLDFIQISVEISNKLSIETFSDGGAALVLVSGETAVKLGLEVIAKILGYGDAAQVLAD